MSSQPDPVLALGECLAGTLEEWDQLGRWMAHYVAELVTAADQTGTPHAKAAAAKEIMRLWAHRSALNRPYPLENYDRIFAMLDHLGDESAGRRLTRYFGDRNPSEAELAVNPYLEAAAQLEETVREVVRWLIVKAAAAAEERDSEWAQIAMQLESDDTGRMLLRLNSMIRRSELAHRTRDAGATAPDALGTMDDVVTDEPLDSRAMLAPETVSSPDNLASDRPTDLEPHGVKKSDKRLDYEAAELSEIDVVAEMLDRSIGTLQRLRATLKSP